MDSPTCSGRVMLLVPKILVETNCWQQVVVGFQKKKWLCSYTKIQITCLPTDQKPMIQSDKMYIHLTKFLENSSSEILAIIWNQDFPRTIAGQSFTLPTRTPLLGSLGDSTQAASGVASGVARRHSLRELRVFGTFNSLVVEFQLTQLGKNMRKIVIIG